MATFTEVRVARKRHAPFTGTGGCEACRRAIEPGETYERFSATPRDEIWNTGGWSHFKAHHPYNSCVRKDDPAWTCT